MCHVRNIRSSKEELVKRAWKAVLAGLFVAAMAMPASADAMGPQTFTGFNAVNPLQPVEGWTYTGGSSYDVGITSAGITGNSLQISNARTSGSFGDWPISQVLGTPATETGNQEFVGSFDVQGDTYREGLQASVAPQTTGGARMSFVSFTDKPGGIQVAFSDARNANFRTVPIGTPLTYGSSHRVTIVLDLYDGPHNDVAQVFIDDPNRQNPLVPATVGDFEGFFAPVDNPSTANKVKAGQSVPMKWKIATAVPTTWEDYYRYDSESNEFETAPWGTRQVDSLIFQARQQQKVAGSPCAEDPGRLGFEARDCWAANEGHGLLFDNVTVSSDTTLTLPTTAAPVDASFYGTPIFKSVTGPCADVEDYDPIETADPPGASHLTYDAATGIWHYNWQTTKSMAGAGCVKLTLLATGDYALFKISK
jgi:hypothetical protein